MFISIKTQLFKFNSFLICLLFLFFLLALKPIKAQFDIRNGATFTYTPSNPFNVASETLNVKDLTFSNDGLRMFIIGTNTPKIYQYNLTTAFDLTTASFSPTTNNPLSVSSQEGGPQGIAFSNDGLRMFIVGNFDDEVNQYDLTTAFDITTASFSATTNNPYEISSEETTPTGITFSNDGMRMFIVGLTGDEVNQYNLTTAFDITTASFTTSANNPFDIFSQQRDAQGITFSNDGMRMFIVGSNAPEVNQYDLTTAFDITTASFSATTNNPFNVSAEGTSPTGISFSNDGLKMFISNDSGDDVNQYDLTTAFDITTASFTATSGNPLDVSSEDDSPTGISFSSDGMRMFIVSSLGFSGEVNQYDLTTAFDITTASFTSSGGNPFTFSEDGNPKGISFSNDGHRMFILGFSNDEVYQYDLTTAFDITTASSFTATTNNPFDLSSEVSSPRGINFSNDGHRMFILGDSEVNQYDLTTAFDITTASFTSSTNNPFSVFAEATAPTGLSFSSDGLRMFIVGLTGDEVNQYDLTTAFDITTASFTAATNNPFDVSSEQTTPEAITFSNDGRRMFILGNDGDLVTQYDLNIPEIKLSQATTELIDGSGVFDFEEVLQNNSSAIISFSIENIGTAPLNLSSEPRVVIAGTNAGDFALLSDAPTSIAAGTSSTFEIQFTPADIGLREATVTIANNDTDEGTYTFTLRGTGSEAEPILELSQGGTIIEDNTVIDFGSATWGSNGAEKTFKIENTGITDLILQENPSIAFVGTEGHFTVSQSPTLTTIPPGMFTEFKVQFTPQSDQLETESILIYSNENDFSNPRGINIKGQGEREVLNPPPSNFTATAISDEAIALSWQDNTPNETGFVLSKSLTNLADSYLVLAVLDANVTSYIDNTLAPNQTVYYKLQAVSERGESVEIGPENATTKNPPKAPTNVLAAAISPSQIVLSWEDNADNETNFGIERSLDVNEGFAQVAIVTQNITNYTDEGLINDTEYFYRIRALNEAEGNSPYSNVSGTRTSDIPAAPSGVIATLNSNNHIILNWQDNAQNEEEFRVERFNILEESDAFTVIAILAANSINFIDTTTNANQVYVYRVRASNSDGISLESNLVSIQTQIDPNVQPPSFAPQDLEATPVSDSEIALTWRPLTTTINPDINYFVRVEVGTHPNGPFTEVTQTNISNNRYQLTELNKNTVYYVQIRYANDGGDSPYSDIASATPECRVVASVSDDEDDVVVSICSGKSAFLVVKTNVINASYQWIRDGLTLPNSNQSFYYASESGEYNCIIRTGECIKTALFPVVVTLTEPIIAEITQIDNRLEANLTAANSYQWYKEEEAIEGATDFQYDPSEDGLYYLVVTQGECSSTSNFIFFTTTSINEDVSDEIIVYPNPTTNQAKLKWSNDYLGDYILSVYDLTGRKHPIKKGIKSHFFLEEQIDLSAFESGVYLLELKGEGFQAIKKVIKE